MTGLAFTKYEGLGNDFIVVDQRDSTLMSVETVRRLCDRRFGIGADGVLSIVKPVSPEARARMVVLNADGSRPEMCGNGLRCVALHLSRLDDTNRISYVVDTDAGPLGCSVEREGVRAMVSLELGVARPIGEYSTEFDGKEYRFTRISTGNPHAIIFDTGLGEVAIDRLGPLVSANLEGGSNVEFATVRSPQSIDLSVWERGVGRTLACGTGAAATAAAAALDGRSPYDAPIELRLPGGTLWVTVRRETLSLELRGPARLVFSGEVA